MAASAVRRLRLLLPGAAAAEDTDGATGGRVSVRGLMAHLFYRYGLFSAWHPHTLATVVLLLAAYLSAPLVSVHLPTYWSHSVFVAVGDDSVVSSSTPVHNSHGTGSASTPTPASASTPTPASASTPTPASASTPTPASASTPTPASASTPTPASASTPTPASASTPTPASASTDTLGRSSSRHTTASTGSGDAAAAARAENDDREAGWAAGAAAAAAQPPFWYDQQPYIYLLQILVRSAVVPWIDHLSPQQAYRSSLLLSHQLTETVNDFQYGNTSLMDVCYRVEEPGSAEPAPAASLFAGSTLSGSSSSGATAASCADARDGGAIYRLLPRYNCLVLSPALLWHNSITELSADQRPGRTVRQAQQCHRFCAGYSVCDLMFGLHTPSLAFTLSSRDQPVVTFSVTLALKHVDKQYIAALRRHLRQLYPLYSDVNSGGAAAGAAGDGDDSTATIHWYFPRRRSLLLPLTVLAFCALLAVYMYFSLRQIAALRGKRRLAVYTLLLLVASVTSSCGQLARHYDGHWPLERDTGGGGPSPASATGDWWWWWVWWLKWCWPGCYPLLVSFVSFENAVQLTSTLVVTDQPRSPAVSAAAATTASSSSSAATLAVSRVLVARAVGRAGHRLFCHSLQQMALLCVGLLSGVPAVKHVCAPAAVGLLCDTLLQLGFFLPLLCADARRQSVRLAQRQQQQQRRRRRLPLPLPSPPSTSPHRQLHSSLSTAASSATAEAVDGSQYTVNGGDHCCWLPDDEELCHGDCSEYCLICGSGDSAAAEKAAAAAAAFVSASGWPTDDPVSAYAGWNSGGGRGGVWPRRVRLLVLWSRLRLVQRLVSVLLAALMLVAAYNTGALANWGLALAPVWRRPATTPAATHHRHRHHHQSPPSAAQFNRSYSALSVDAGSWSGSGTPIESAAAAIAPDAEATAAAAAADRNSTEYLRHDYRLTTDHPSVQAQRGAASSAGFFQLVHPEPHFWSALLRVYNVSLERRRLSLLPPVRLSVPLHLSDTEPLLPPLPTATGGGGSGSGESSGEKEQRRSAVQQLRLGGDHPVFTDEWSDESGGNYYAAGDYIVFVDGAKDLQDYTVLILLTLPSLTLLVYVCVRLYRLLCPRDYAEWRSSWRRNTAAGATRQRSSSSSYCSASSSVHEREKLLARSMPLRLLGHRRPVECLVYDEQLQLLASCCLAGQLRVWQPSLGACVRVINRDSAVSAAYQISRVHTTAAAASPVAAARLLADSQHVSGSNSGARDVTQSAPSCLLRHRASTSATASSSSGSTGTETGSLQLSYLPLEQHSGQFKCGAVGDILSPITRSTVSLSTTAVAARSPPPGGQHSYLSPASHTLSNLALSRLSPASPLSSSVCSCHSLTSSVSDLALAGAQCGHNTPNSVLTFNSPASPAAVPDSAPDTGHNNAAAAAAAGGGAAAAVSPVSANGSVFQWSADYAAAAAVATACVPDQQAVRPAAAAAAAASLPQYQPGHRAAAPTLSARRPTVLEVSSPAAPPPVAAPPAAAPPPQAAAAAAAGDCALSLPLQTVWCVDFGHLLLVVGGSGGCVEVWDTVDAHLALLYGEVQSAITHVKLLNGGAVVAARLDGSLTVHTVTVTDRQQRRPLTWTQFVAIRSECRQLMTMTGGNNYHPSAAAAGGAAAAAAGLQLGWSHHTTVLAHQLPLSVVQLSSCRQLQQQLLVTASADCTLKVFNWNERHHQQQQQLQQLQLPVPSLRQRHRLLAHCAPVTACCVDKHRHQMEPLHIFSGSADGYLCVWNLTTGVCVYSILAHDDGCVQWVSASAACVLSVGGGGGGGGSGATRLCVWERYAGTLVSSVPLHHCYCQQTLPLSPSVCATARQGSLVLWDLELGKPIRLVRLGESDSSVFVQQMVLLDDAIACDYDCEIRVIRFPCRAGLRKKTV